MGITQYHIYIILLCLFILYSFFQIYRLHKYTEKIRERYFKLTASSNIYLFEYYVKKDTLNLSAQCAELLHLPTRVEHYMDGLKNNADIQVKKSLSLIDLAMKSQSKPQQLKIKRSDNSLGMFQLRCEIFYESNRPMYIMGLFADVTEEFHQKEKLATKAQIDGLTKVYNPWTCRKLLADYVASHTPGIIEAFIILDIDNFKNINDRLGHQTGDRTLQIIARTLKSIVRSTDFIGRMGGDEFCIYLQDIPSSDFINQLCTRINSSVVEAMKTANINMEITVSIGAAIVHDGDSLEAVYDNADKALYMAKRKGRNTYTVLE